MTSLHVQDPIDAVITWVDGDAADNRQERGHFLSHADSNLHENAINPHRWANNNEILYCLQSIENNATWVRTIWIVTAGERPDLSSLSTDLGAKIRFVSHRDIFDGYEEYLPTFNSLAIESMIWRIKGLSEQFLYFNDDVFLTKHILPSHVFKNTMPVLRGAWTDFSTVANDLNLQSDPAHFNEFMQINAGRISGFNSQKIFAAAHVIHPLLRSKMKYLFEQFPNEFRNNLRHRFRDLSQFLPQGLHNHHCISDECAVIELANDHLHIRSGQGHGRPLDETLTVLKNIPNSDIKFLCVNDLPQLEKLVPDTRRWIEQAIGGFQDS